MAVNKRLLQGAAAAGGLVPSEHFGVVLYEGDGSTSHSINGGKFGAAANFNGSSSYIQTDMTYNTIVDVNDKTKDFSFSLWMYQRSQDTVNTANVFVINEYAPSYQYVGLNISPGGDLQWVQYPGGASGVNCNTPTTLNQWIHVVCVRENSSLKIYKDGTLKNTVAHTISNNSLDSTIKWVFGARLDGGNDLYFDGKIDQVRIFTKALSSSEVSTLYAETASTVESLDPLSEDTTDTLQVLGDSSCIATYRFENDETDLSGNYNGTGTAIQYAAGRYGQAASFNGSTSKIDTSLTLDTYTSNGGSISFWFKTSQTSPFQAIIGSQTAQNGASYGTTIFIGDTTSAATNESISIWDYDGATTAAFFAGGGSTTYQDGNWHHVVVTSTSTTKNIYIDGVSQSVSYAGSGSATQNLKFTDIQFGASLGHSSANYFDGEIDQVRIFNKALSASEVATLYNENSLVASYRFEGNANDDTRNYDGTASNVTYEYGLNFTPDFVWLKVRSAAGYNHNVFDTTRGATKRLMTNLSNAEDTNGKLTSFDTGGFTLGAGGDANPSGQDLVAWCLKANGGTTSSNTDGSITSTVQANTDAGFSIVTWTASGVHTIGHGLGVVPEMIIVKRRSSAGVWITYHVGTDTTAPEDYYLQLDSTAARTYYTDIWQSTAPTSSVFTLYDSVSSQDYVAYAFHSVDGFSKFGSYTGNGSATGPIVETGFEPAFVMIKNASSTELGGASWLIYDNKRSTTNPRDRRLFADLDAAEAQNDNYDLDFLSNGFQIKSGTSNYGYNNNGDTYIYMAFAADPDTEAPAVAKSFSTVTYTGNSSTQNITGLGFSPSLVWIKSKNISGANHNIYDSVRGAGKFILSNSTLAEITTTEMSGFSSDGFNFTGTAYDSNNTGNNYVAWAWKADDNEPTINTEGSLDTVVSANANAGFSIVKVTGAGVNTFGHGLSSAPELIIVKSLNVAQDWYVYHKDLNGGSNPAHYFIKLNSTDAETFNASSGGSIWNSTAPTSTVFSLGTSLGNCIAYCFHSVSGYSKIGSYTGTGSEQLINTGFAVDFVLIKSTTTAQNWMIYDNVRGDSKYLIADSSGAEGSPASNLCTFESNGFKVYSSNSENQSGQTYIYMAFKIN